MFFSPTKRRPNKIQTRQKENADSVSAIDAVSQAVDRASLTGAEGGQSYAGGSLTGIEEGPSANALIDVSVANAPPAIGRGRGIRTPTPPTTGSRRATSIDNALGVVESRLNMFDKRISAIESMKGAIDTMVSRFEELLKMQTELVGSQSAVVTNANPTERRLRTLPQNRITIERRTNLRGHVTGNYSSDDEVDGTDGDPTQPLRRRDISLLRKKAIDRPGAFVPYKNLQPQINSIPIIPSSGAIRKQDIMSNREESR